MDTAFELIRSTARRDRRRLADVARDVIDDASTALTGLDHEPCD